MRNWSFSFGTKEESESAFMQLFEIFKEAEDFKKKRIIICKAEENGENKVFLSIEDKVPGSFIVSVSNAFEKNLKNAFSVIKADCKEGTIELPVDSKILSWYTIEKEDKA